MYIMYSQITASIQTSNTEGSFVSGVCLQGSVSSGHVSFRLTVMWMGSADLWISWLLGVGWWSLDVWGQIINTFYILLGVTSVMSKTVLTFAINDVRGDDVRGDDVRGDDERDFTTGKSSQTWTNRLSHDFRLLVLRHTAARSSMVYHVVLVEERSRGLYLVRPITVENRQTNVKHVNGVMLKLINKLIRIKQVNPD